ncbi:MAG: carboxypeptidase-like regulatory domain-containing protein [Nitrosopumilaceae archaeon]
MKLLILALVTFGLLNFLWLTPVYTESINLSTIEETKLRLNDIRPTTFNEGQPVVFSGKLTTQSGQAIPKAEIVIKSDATCPPDGIIAKGITDKHGRFWIYTISKVWDPVDNMIKAQAEFLGDEKFSSSISRHEIIVVYPINGDSC